MKETNSTDEAEEYRMKNVECRTKEGHNCARDPILPIRHSSFAIFLALIALLLPTFTFAQTANRWLLIFDTSSSMHSRTKGTEDILQDLLTTGMHGQLHQGDTIGIWTFSDKLHAGEAPLQVWSPEMAQNIARHTLQYFETLRYGKSANLQAALTNMYAVVDSSDFITVILFSDGEQSIKGTPFDDEINKQYKDNYKQQKKAALPIVTVLQAKHGSFTTNTVNFGPWPANIPEVPNRPKPLEPQTAPKPAPKPETAPPIIFDGRKSQTAVPATDSTAQPAPQAGNATELAPPVTQPTVSPTPAETPVAPQPAVAAPAGTETTQPAATQPAEVAADNQPESKSVATPVPPPAANESKPPPAASAETASKPAAMPPTVETATSVPLFSARNIAIVSLAFAAAVCGLLLMAARNARKSQASLITRSLDREQR